jgi:DAK2 domain fusion protein YloV
MGINMANRTKFKLTGDAYVKMICAAALNLQSHAGEINDLNVFPVPDGDTGDNMLSTIMGGVERTTDADESLAVASRKVADGMLLSARGNSGVILSQFFDGIAEGFSNVESAEIDTVSRAFRLGVRRAYEAVMKPTEGTILTVANDATEYACKTRNKSVEAFLGSFVDEARRSLDRTPELLPVLKSAGVVDSGGAGLLCIIEGMCRIFEKNADFDANDLLTPAHNQAQGDVDLAAFGENDELVYGYCTELLVRLQTVKTDIDAFDSDGLKNTLSEIGDSVAVVKSGSILKLHVHTKAPYKVLELCQQFGEFLKVKIENMSLQHNTVIADGAEEKHERRDIAVVVAACGEGIKQTFLECGADLIVEGGQSMNPSSEDFIKAFGAVNADTVFVFPNNSNVILAARQAAAMYKDSDVRVIESKTVGDGYAALSMMDISSGNVDEIEKQLYDNMQGIVTAEVARCIRDAEMDGVELHNGQYIGYVGKKLLSAADDRFDAAAALADGLELDAHALCLVFRGQESTQDEAERLKKYIEGKYPSCEVCLIDGKQEIYSYIIVAE